MSSTVIVLSLPQTSHILISLMRKEEVLGETGECQHLPDQRSSPSPHHLPHPSSTLLPPALLTPTIYHSTAFQIKSRVLHVSQSYGNLWLTNKLLYKRRQSSFSISAAIVKNQPIETQTNLTKFYPFSGRVAFEKLTDLDYKGETYYTIRNLSLYECQGWCREEPECQAASFR